MSFFAKVKNSLVARAAEAVAVSLTTLLLWAAYQISPAILPAIEAGVSKSVLFALLVASVVLNVIFFLVAWSSTRNDSFRLKYGIYWDSQKNPHCPSCRTPVAAYGDYQMGGLGYYCKPCKKVFALADASGRNIDPSQVLQEL